MDNVSSIDQSKKTGKRQFRSILRNGGKLNLFIPSERMRKILIDFIIQNNVTRKKVDKSKLSPLAF